MREFDGDLLEELDMDWWTSLAKLKMPPPMRFKSGHLWWPSWAKLKMASPAI